MSFRQTNLLLDCLPPELRETLMPHVEHVPLPVGTSLYEVEQVPRSVYFITSGMASIVTTLAGGDAVEVGTVGREGLTGSFAALGPATGTSRCFMQVSGTGLRMSLKRFEEAFQGHPVLRRLVLRHVQYETLVLAQLMACNRLHDVEERLARWLLTVEDKIGEPTLRLTQEFLAQMLGSRRSTVTITAGTLQRSGMIEYHRGQVKVLNRPGLEDIACECYQITRKLFQNLYN